MVGALPIAGSLARRILPGLIAVVLLAGCGDSSEQRSATSGAPTTTRSTAVDATRFPAIRAVELTRTGDGIYRAAVTVSSPYDTPQRYADGWRVLAAGGDRVLGEHELAHDHASEQPFTREQRDLRIPSGVARVTVQGRDKRNGYGGMTVTVDVPR